MIALPDCRSPQLHVGFKPFSEEYTEKCKAERDCHSTFEPRFSPQNPVLGIMLYASVADGVELPFLCGAKHCPEEDNRFCGQCWFEPESLCCWLEGKALCWEARQPFLFLPNFLFPCLIYDLCPVEQQGGKQWLQVVHAEKRKQSITPHKLLIPMFVLL